MKKLRLDLDDLQVTSFSPAHDRSADRGTVRGRALSEGDWCPDTRNTYDECSVYYCGTDQNTWNESCLYGVGCQDSIFVCGSHLCPLTP